MSNRLTDPYTDEGVLSDTQDRMEALSPLPGLPDIVLIDRLRFRLEVALQREQSRIDEARLLAKRTLTRSQHDSIVELVARARTSSALDKPEDIVDEMMTLLGITTIEG